MGTFEAHEQQATQALPLDPHQELHSPPFAPTTPAPFFDQDQQTRILDELQLACQDEHPSLDQFRHPATSPSESIDQHPSLISTLPATKSDRPSVQPAIVSPFLPSPSSSSASSNNTISGSNSSSTSSVYSSARTIKPPPISITPSLRRAANHAQPSISTILSQDPESNLAGRRLELEESSDWDSRTGRSDALAMRLNQTSSDMPFLRDGGRDRWGNRWGIENHVLSPVISERTEPTHTSVSSPLSARSYSTNFSVATSGPSQPVPHQQQSSSIMPGCYPPTENSSNPHLLSSLSPSNQTNTSHSITSTRSQQSPTHHIHPSESISKAHPHPHSSTIENHSAHTHHQHAISLLKRKKIKNHIANRQRDLDVANRQINKRIEKERRDQMIRARDEIVAKLMENPNDAKLVRDLGKLYLRFNEPDPNDNQSNSARKLRNSKAAPRSEPSLKLAIHYLEQSIQMDNRDSLSWLFLGRAWSLLLAYPTEHDNEREQRLLNSSLAFRKAIHISSNIVNPSIQCIRQTNRYRLAYAEHLESLHKYKEAASILQDGLGIDATDVECWWELGRIMELWASDEVGLHARVTKQERVDRLRCACEAYKKATELEPDDSIIRQGRLDGEKALQTFTAELQAEEELQAKSLKTAEDIRLTAERLRVLNLSPVTNKAPHTNSVKPQQITNKSSVLALKKLVSELREIPEFGKKAPPLTDPTPVQPGVEQSTQDPSVKPDDQICSTQVESVISSSPAPSATGANRTRPLTGENSPLPQVSPLSRVIHENPSASGLPPISQPKNPARYPTQISSPKDLSPSSTQSQSQSRSQSQDDVKMMLMNLRTGSIEPPLEFDHSDDQPPTSRVMRNGHHLYSYQPPSPSALPTSMMQSLSARLGTPKAHQSCSPKSSASSNSRSFSNSSQNAGEWHQHESNLKPDTVESGLNVHQQNITHSPAPPCQSPTHNRPRPLKAQLTDIIRGNSGTTHETHFNQPSQQHPEFTSPADNHPQHHSKSSGDRIFSPDPPDRRQSTGQHCRSQNPDGPHSHSPSSHQLPLPNQHSANHLHHHPKQPHASLLKKPALNNGSGLLSPLSKEVTTHPLPADSPPPPHIPPRPASLRSHAKPHDSRPSQASSVLDNNRDRHSASFMTSHQDHAFRGPPHLSHDEIHQLQNVHGPSSHGEHIGRPNSSCSSPRSPARFSTMLSYHHSPPSSPLSTQPNPAYNYSLIDAHLQSILDIDLKRKEELKEIKKQIRKADEWAESRRRSVIEELRRVCTPVNGPNTGHHSDHQASSSHSRSLSRARPPSEVENIKPSNHHSVDHSRPMGHKINVGHQNRNTNPFEPIGSKPYNGAIRSGHPKRSASTPPELNHHHPHHQQQPINTSGRKQGLVYSDVQLSGDELQEAAIKDRTLYSATVRPNLEHHLPHHSYQPLSPLARPHSQLKLKNVHPAPPLLQHPTINQALVNEFDKLGPAGFAINGITSIIQLLHQHHSNQIDQP